MKVLAILNVDKENAQRILNQNLEGPDFCKQVLQPLQESGIQIEACEEIPNDIYITQLTDHIVELYAEEAEEKYGEALERLGE